VFRIHIVFNADPEPAFYLNADPDPAFYLNADPDSCGPGFLSDFAPAFRIRIGNADPDPAF
jgi:hypothetical protein